MANVIRLKRASGSDPAASDLVSGEPAVRTDTGELFFKKDDGSIAKVAGAGGGPDFKYLALRNAANNGAASFPNADFTLVTSGTTSAITPTAANTLLVSVNGVIQKPNTGTSTPSQGFALSGSTIKFGANISAAPDFILYQESGGIGEPSDDTVSEVKLKVSNSPVNGYFLSAQSGNNGGLTWAAPVATSCTGNSATATALATARTINGTSFDGTANITVTAAAGTLTGNTLNSSVVTSSLTSLGDLTSLTVTGNMAVDTNTLFVDSSNNRVGIGTTSPSSPFTVSDGDQGFEVHPNSSSTIRLLAFDRTNSVRKNLRIDALAYEIQCNNGTEKIRIDSSGNVGIGTSSPTEVLHIQTGSSSDSFPVKFIRGGSAVAGYLYSDSVGSGIVGSGKNLNEAGIYLVNNSRIDFRVNGSERMRIDSSGRLGIGTTSPSSYNSSFDDLVIEGSSNQGITIATTNTSALCQIGFADGTSGDAQFRGLLRYDHSSDHFAFYTAGLNERMRIDSDGRVQIGSTNNSSTGTKFVVGNGNNMAATALINTQDTDINALTLSNWDGATTSNKVLIGFDNSGRGSFSLGMPAATNALAFFGSIDGSSNERMRIDSSGRLLVGTTSILHSGDHKLYVAGTDASTSISLNRYSDNDFASYIYFRKSRSGTIGGNTSVQDDDLLGRIYFEGNDGSSPVSAAYIEAHVDGTPGNQDMPGRLEFLTAADGTPTPVERMRIDSSGKVGIGTSTIGNKLQVHESGSFASFAGFSNDTTGSSSSDGLIVGIDSNEEGVLYHYENKAIRFGTNNSERMRLDSSGRLLIGTTNNTNGHISASNLAVQGADLAIFKDSGGDNSGVSGHKLKFVTQSGSLGEIDVLSEGGGGPNGRGGAMRFYTKANNTASASERLRITQEGNIKSYRFNTLFGNEGLELFNTTTGGPQLQISRISGDPLLLNRNTTDGKIIELRRGWSAGGSIDVGVNSATYNTSSDYRLKENIVAISDGIARLKTLKPSRFNWIGHPNSTRDGFIAHEVTAVPEAITGTKDEVYTEDQPDVNIKAGDPKYQGIDQSRLVPLLVAALQEAIGRIEALEAK